MIHCHLCDCEATEDDYCSGCDEYICEACDETGAMGDHNPEDHLEIDDDDLGEEGEDL